MTDEALDNPAARLKYWLPQAVEPAKVAKVHRQGGRRGEPAPPMSVRDVWAGIWELDINHPDELLTLFDNGLTLVKEAREIRRTVTGIQSRYASHALTHFDQVEKCVAHFVAMEGSSIDQMMDPMGEGGWLSLDLFSELLREHERETVPTDEERKSLIDQTQTLIKSVLEDADLDVATKAQIYESLKDVQDALARFTIGGAPVVEEASDRLCGAFVRTVLRTSGEFLQHPATQMILTLLNAIGLTFGFGADYLAISSQFAGELPAGS